MEGTPKRTPKEMTSAANLLVGLRTVAPDSTTRKRPFEEDESIQSPSTNVPQKVDPFSRLTPLMKILYGDEFVENLTSKGVSVRKIWEQSAPVTQCSHTIGEPKRCWLCGGSFDYSKSGLKPICDHVLPIAQSMFFLDLYSAKRQRAPIIPQEALRLFRLEYAWAHGICNLKKKDLMFIRPIKRSIGPSAGMEVDTVKINTFLDNLSEVSSMTQQGDDVIRSQLSTNKQAAYDSMNKKMSEIVTFLNAPISRREGNLQLLAQTSVYTDDRIVSDYATKKARTGMGRKTFRRKRNGKSVRRSTAKGHGANSRTRRKV